MNIGIIGAGNLGVAVTRRLIENGHAVMLSFSRDPFRLRQTAMALQARAGTVAEAVQFGEVIALAVPWGAVRSAIAEAGPLDGKVLWDCTNALKSDLSGLEIGTTTSAGETIQRLVPAARVVKGIPPSAELLQSSNRLLNGVAAGCFLCGDDAGAKSIVRPLLESLPATVVEAGPLENARYAEAAAFLLVRLAFGLKMGPRLGLNLQTG